MRSSKLLRFLICDFGFSLFDLRFSLFGLGFSLFDFRLGIPVAAGGARPDAIGDRRPAATASAKTSRLKYPRLLTRVRLAGS
jgi:hypothetical protein